MGLDSATPTLMAIDSRGLPVRSVGYCRSLDSGPAGRRVNRSLFDTAGRAIKQWDPRLWVLQQDDAATPANRSTAYSLSDAVLLSLSVDAGLQIELPGLAGEGLRAWDGRGTRSEAGYDGLLRPVAMFEQGATQSRRCVERMTYGYPGHGDRDHNQYGQLIRHDDPAGSVLLGSFSLTGQKLALHRRFVLDAASPDWPESEADRETALEPGDGALSSWRFGPQDDVLEQTDAKGNRQRQTLTVDGQISGSQLLLNGNSGWQGLVNGVGYNAQGQIEHETAGNGVRTMLIYSPEDGRLTERQARRGDELLQHLLYAYDPMGNVLSIEDKALPVRYFANQRIEPISRFVYDSLYQLIKATGWEAGSTHQGPDSLGRNDPAAVSNYRQSYRYDESGNLLELTHVGAQRHGRQIRAARYNNRCLPYRDGVPPTEDDITAAFDAGGNCLELDPGRFLAWDLRNQLSAVTPIERDSGLNDSEGYIYDGGGQRVRKLRTLQTGARTLVAEVRYLPGLELRIDGGTGESLQVIVAQGGLGNVRILHWDSTPPLGENDCYRYSVADHLGSVSLELADDGRIISREHFYPFGETACLAGDDAIEVSYKTVRYSGKERDATGLYYYGFRYYVPWLQRWLSPDPAGDIDGLNLFRMLMNNPIIYVDGDGQVVSDVNDQLLKDWLTDKFWSDALLKKQPKRSGARTASSLVKAAADKKKKKTDDTSKRALVDIVTDVGPKLLERLAEAGKDNPEQLKLYRGMKTKQADAILHWDQHSKARVESLLKKEGTKQLSAPAVAAKLVKEESLEILPVSGHLGDYGQAKKYGNKIDEHVVEFTLKPGAHTLLFSQDYLALAADGKGATFFLPQLAAADNQGPYKVAADGEGNLAGYIGMKSEQAGDFSFVMGKSKPTHLLFQLFIESVRKVPKQAA